MLKTPLLIIFFQLCRNYPYLLAKHLNRISSPLTTNEFTVKNSFDFAEEVVNYDHNLYMASLDVQSLIPNIPFEETIKNCVNDLFSNSFCSGKLSRKDLCELLKLATTKSSCSGFTFSSHTA